MRTGKRGRLPVVLLVALFVCVAGVGVALYPIYGVHLRRLAYDIATPDPDPERLAVFESEIARYDWDTDMVMAIAKAESALDFDARGDTDPEFVYVVDGREYGYSLGALQVRILEGREHCDTLDIATNVYCAYEIYAERGWSAWTKYNDGAYRLHL